MTTCKFPAPHRLSARIPRAGGLAAAAAVALAACGSASTTSTKAAPTPVPFTATSAPSASSASAYTVATASVSGLGSVLVDGQGRTLYLLNSEAGGKLTCTDANGCTKVWPDTELPSGVSRGVAGSGVAASLLGTVPSPEGKLYLTYGANQWPLYTFSGDSAAGQAKGQGIHSFGGTWSAVNPTGDPAVTPATPGSTTSSSASHSGGY